MAVKSRSFVGNGACETRYWLATYLRLLETNPLLTAEQEQELRRSYGEGPSGSAKHDRYTQDWVESRLRRQ